MSYHSSSAGSKVPPSSTSSLPCRAEPMRRPGHRLLRSPPGVWASGWTLFGSPPRTTSAWSCSTTAIGDSSSRTHFDAAAPVGFFSAPNAPMEAGIVPTASTRLKDSESPLSHSGPDTPSSSLPMGRSIPSPKPDCCRLGSRSSTNVDAATNRACPHLPMLAMRQGVPPQQTQRHAPSPQRPLRRPTRHLPRVSMT
jgi:hypothetical protein